MRTAVPNYGAVRYAGFCRGIDLLVHAGQGAFEYDFRVAAHADPAQIRMRFQGAGALSLNGVGELRVGGGWLIQRKPRAYQDFPGGRREVAARFRVENGSTVTFTLGDYDPSRELIIDPVVCYSSYLGGQGSEVGSAVAVDKAGNVYVGGGTLAPDFPGNSGSGVRPTGMSGEMGFVSKFTPVSGGKTSLLFTLFLGDQDYTASAVEGLAVDADGNLIVVGQNDAVNFPTQNAAQPRISGTTADCSSTGGTPISCRDGFVTKFGPDGRSLLFSTYWGGKRENWFNDVAVDSEGDATRWMMVALSHLFPWRGALVKVKPSTLIGWHRKGFRLFWRWKSKPTGRP